MTFEIILVLSILVVSLFLFITEKLPMDVVALMVMGGLALSGIVTTEEALAGFSNPAVVTVWAMFILSDGLTRTGIADLLGRQILKMAGSGEARIVTVIMLSSGGLSAFMNNIGVAALMLPVVMDIASKTGHAPSRLLMPLAYGSLLGGLTTLIGTPPNLLISNALTEAQLTPFSLFDFFPIGFGVMLAGTFFVAFFGRRLLPENNVQGLEKRKSGSLHEQYDLGEYTRIIRIPEGSILHGKTLSECRFGSVLELSVVAILRGDQVFASPGPTKHLRSGDQLLVQGQLTRFREVKEWRRLFAHTTDADLSQLYVDNMGVMELLVSGDDRSLGKTLLEINYQLHYGVKVMAIRRESEFRRTLLAGQVLQPGDRLLVHGPWEDLEKLRQGDAFLETKDISLDELQRVYRLQERMFNVTVPGESPLIGQTLRQSRLGDAFSFNVHGVTRDNKIISLPGPDLVLEQGDRLLVQGWRDFLKILSGFNNLEVETDPGFNLSAMVNRKAGIAEAVLTPRSTLVGRTPRELNFHETYGLQLLAVWRAGKIHRTELRNVPFQFGDAYLFYGRWKALARLKNDHDFMLLTPGIGKPLRTEKGPWAALIIAGVLFPVLMGWLSIAIAAVVGCTLMILTGCITMNQAYRAISWKSIFLISGMLPLGVAMEKTGAASLLAEWVMSALGNFGPWPVIIGLYLVTALATTIIPTAALVVMMAPIVLKACSDLGVSPQTGMMAIAMAASASFTSPISHPANILVMGPGGYRFKDYLKLGIPLALVVFVAVFVLLPILWPLHPPG